MENTFFGFGMPELVALAGIAALAVVILCAVRVLGATGGKIGIVLRNRKTYMILAPLIASFALGMVGPYSFASDANNACAVSPICENEPGRGILTTTTYGFPLPVQETKTFRPISPIHYASTSAESRSFSPLSLAVNAIFWFALLRLVADIKAGLSKNPEKQGT